jgi:hypothetical protein
VRDVGSRAERAPRVECPRACPRMPDGLRVTIRRSKTDQEGQGHEIAIPRGYRLRPVETVQAWLAAAEINSGPRTRRARPCTSACRRH